MDWLKCVFLILLPLQAVALPAGMGADAFDALRGLQGKWAIEADRKTLAIEMTYDAGSKGSIVTEQFGKELSVFYRDGDSLLMTHFCNAGSQPRLRLAASQDPKLLVFEMFDVTGLKSPDADRVQRVIYKLLDADKISLEIVWKRGMAMESEKYVLHRKSAAP